MKQIWDRTQLALGDLASRAGDLFEPTVRLGVTGLSGAGKTVFITSLIRNLLVPERLTLVDAVAEGRLRNTFLRPQPDDQVPRFEYEEHLQALLGEDRHWPESTRNISQLRLTLEFDPETFLARRLGGGRLNVDIVDYPGEWLLDLPLLNWSYAEWSRRAIAAARGKSRAKLAKSWLSLLAELDPAQAEDEALARRAADEFKQYLAACRSEPHALSALPPGRFLMPGELEGSPALTFAPLDLAEPQTPARNSLGAMMERRYESYKAAVVKPFFKEHFARLDRQIVLVDALAALNAGPDAVADLSTALTDILGCFRPGSGSWLSSILSRRIDRILFAATKADHLHHTSHDRLERILRGLVEQAIGRAEFAGASVEVAALAAIRATREATARKGGAELPCIVGVPEQGERIAGKTFDGKQEVAVFPGELPQDPGPGLKAALQALEGEYRFVRFRPPLTPTGAGETPFFPHIRLDRAINFLIGDKLD